MRQAKKFATNVEIAENMNNAFWQLARLKTTNSRVLTSYATVFETKDYYLLRSYGNFVACIHKRSRICYNAQSRIEMPSEVVQKQIELFAKTYDSYSMKVYSRYK